MLSNPGGLAYITHDSNMIDASSRYASYMALLCKIYYTNQGLSTV